ncbi:hypothetical protein CEP54_010984 [Fusarium duplospermum]|uniref:Uncharacterized protein n=1 Tax=Fusarium duplospermum TaxID=1325734 RepID=A0A428PH06_9HYPO|nr:hypothetical protein CEP54_010984 [Fusarium duplospermum]
MAATSRILLSAKTSRYGGGSLSWSIITHGEPLMWWMSQFPSTGTGVPMVVVIYSCFDRSMFGLLALSRAGSLRALRHTTKRQIADEPGSCQMAFQGVDGRLGSVPNVLLDVSVSVEAPASSTVQGVRMWSVRMPRLHPEDPEEGTDGHATAHAMDNELLMLMNSQQPA